MLPEPIYLGRMLLKLSLLVLHIHTRAIGMMMKIKISLENVTHSLTRACVREGQRQSPARLQSFGHVRGQGHACGYASKAAARARVGVAQLYARGVPGMYKKRRNAED